MADDFQPRLTDEEDEDVLLAAQEAMDRRAAGVLVRVCRDVLAEPAPAELASASEALRQGLATKNPDYGYFASACGRELPDLDDEDMWLAAAAATISPREHPGGEGEDLSAVATLEHPDWVALVAGLAIRGVGTRLDAGLMKPDIGDIDDLDDELAVRASLEQDDEDDVMLDHAVAVLTPLWQTLGIVDSHEQLTALGRWGLPRAVLTVWGGKPGEGDRLEEEQAQTALSVLARRPVTLPELRVAAAAEGVFADEDSMRRSLIWREEVFACDDDVWVHLPTLVSGAVLTHRLVQDELDLGVLAAGLDLDLFSLMALDGFALSGGGTVKTRFRRDGELPGEATIGMVGPSGWLAGFAAGDLVGMRYTEGALALDRVDESALDTSHTKVVIDAARRAAELDAAVGDPRVPGASGVDVVVVALRERGGLFAVPMPPLSQLLGDRDDIEVHGGHLGVPGTAWYGEPSWLSGDARAAYRLWQDAFRTFRLTGAVPAEEDLRPLVEGVDPLTLELVAEDVTAEPELDPLLVRVVEATSGAGRADPLYLRARAAEGRGDVAAWSSFLEQALEADPEHEDAAGDLADLRAVAGDAREAERLYRIAGLDGLSAELQALRPMLAPPAGEVGRNKPCPCGSGKKYKVCHGRTAQHPLGTRSLWLWHKVTHFARRGGQRDTVLAWASAFSGEPQDHRRTIELALTDGFVQDTAIIEGELLEEFLEVLGPLLPDDERTLAERWSRSERRLMEVSRVLPMRGIEARDLVTGEMIEVRDWRITGQVAVKDLLLGRPLDDGEGALRFFADPVSVPRMLRGPLLPLLRADAPVEQVIDLLSGGGPSALQNTEGHELLDCVGRYEVADLASVWRSLAADHQEEDDRIVVLSTEGRRTVRGTYRRQDGRLVVETNSVERLRELQAQVLAADPGARRVDESTRPYDLSSLPVQPSIVTPEELPAEVIEQVVRSQEEDWLSNPVPALAGRTPREAVGDPELRAEVEALLDDFEWADRRNPQALTMDVARLRAALGVGDRNPR
jgi:hypothetical protein